MRLDTPATAPAADSAQASARPGLMGLAKLMTMAFLGADLAPIAAELIERARVDENDADALMDLSIVLMLQGQRGIGRR